MEKKDIRKPAFMQEAATRSGHPAALEILIAILVFLVGSLLMGIIQIPVWLLYLLGNSDYMSMVRTGEVDMEKMLEISQNIPEWIMILVLVLELLLIATVLLYCRVLEHRKLNTLGFRKKGMAGQYLIGALSGALFFSVAYLLCVVTGSIHWDGISEDVVPLYIVGYLIGYLVQGMAEEVLCRGYLLVSLSRRCRVTTSVVLSALFFAILHGFNAGLSVLALVNLFLFGVFAALLLVDCENIWIVGAFHSIWNFVQGNVYGIQVSGNKVQSSVLVSSSVDGRAIINGGSFGMEGGLAVSLVLLAGIVIVCYRLRAKGAFINESEQPSMYDKRMQQVYYNSGQQGQSPQYGQSQQNQSSPQYGQSQQNQSSPQYGQSRQNQSSPQYDQRQQSQFSSQPVQWQQGQPSSQPVQWQQGQPSSQPVQWQQGQPSPQTVQWQQGQLSSAAGNDGAERKTRYDADYFKD